MPSSDTSAKSEDARTWWDYGITIALALALVDVLAFRGLDFLSGKQWQAQHRRPSGGGFVHPLWISLLWIALPAVPFILSWMLLSLRSTRSKAAGAGIAVGLFGWGTYFGLWALLLLPFGAFMGPPDPFYVWKKVAIVIFLASSVWIVVCSFRIGIVDAKVFLLAIGATLIGIGWGMSSLRDAEYRLERQQHEAVIVEKSPLH